MSGLGRSLDASDALAREGRDAMRAHRYTRTAVALHWLLAVALLAQIGLGLYLQEVPRGTPPRTVWVNFHKSIGITLAVLILVRLAWRLTHRPPPLPESMPPWQRRLAGLSHALLYACMVVVPLAGYTASNFSKYGVKYFNRWLLPPWGPESKPAYALLQAVHVGAAWVLIVLIALHIAAAIWHARRRDDPVFARMLGR